MLILIDLIDLWKFETEALLYRGTVSAATKWTAGVRVPAIGLIIKFVEFGAFEAGNIIHWRGRSLVIGNS